MTAFVLAVVVRARSPRSGHGNNPHAPPCERRSAKAASRRRCDVAALRFLRAEVDNETLPFYYPSLRFLAPTASTSKT